MGVFEQSKQRLHATLLAASGLLTGCVLPPLRQSSNLPAVGLSSTLDRTPILFGTRASGPAQSPHHDYYRVGEGDLKWGLHYELRENPALFRRIKLLNEEGTGRYDFDPLRTKPGDVIKVPKGWLTTKHTPPTPPSPSFGGSPTSSRCTTPEIAVEPRPAPTTPSRSSELSGSASGAVAQSLPVEAAERALPRELSVEKSCCIQPGDTLLQLSRRFLGDSNRVQEILSINAQNGIAIEPQDLPVGMHIVLPPTSTAIPHPPDALFVRVEAEDTLWRLAGVYLGDGRSWGDLERLNPGVSPTKLRVGYLIQVAGSSDAEVLTPKPDVSQAKSTQAVAPIEARVPMHALSPSARCIDFIRKFERPPRLEGGQCLAYQDDAGVWTIGWGHTRGVKPGDRISSTAAEQLLREDLSVAERDIRGCVKVPLCQNEYDALVSAFFNIGGRFRDSSAIRALNSGDRRGAAEGLLLWSKIRVKGELTVADGLVRRRASECLLFCGTPSMTADDAYISYASLKRRGAAGLVTLARNTSRDRFP